jgi:primosomal protein N' (replication factor Y)
MDRDNFYVKELNIRKKANLPPVAKMAAIIVSGRNLNEVHESCLNLIKIYSQYR